MASTMTSALVLLIIFSVISSTVAGPCTFREGSYQVIYGIRNGIVHFRVILRGVPHMASGWTGIGFGRSMINNVMVQSSRVEGGTVSVTFSRPVNSVEFPYDSSLLGCQPWQFVVGLNRMAPNGELHHHTRTPVHQTVCIDECRI